MKIKTRLAMAFLAVTVLPMALIYLAFWGLSHYQINSFKKAYGLSEQVDLLSTNSVQVFNRLTRDSQVEIRKIIQTDPDKFTDREFLDAVNKKLAGKYAYLLVRRDGQIVYNGMGEQEEELYDRLPAYGDIDGSFEGGIYLDGETQHLVKQEDFQFSDGATGSVFIVSGFGDFVPEVKSMMVEIVLAGILILLLVGAALIGWVYKSLLQPLSQLQKATHEIKNGNLDFALDVDYDDEIGQLCQDFEEMRIRLKESTEEKVQYDKESKELISNISHDLKTPITAIKGYVEGIMDGVAASPEKLDKYIRTIYNKANDMDRLIDELTFYSKIDSHKIPYTFSKINVASYFKDCVEEVGLDLDANNIELGYFNYVDEDVVVIADAEQMKRVINNIISNSVKYLDKKKGLINIRIKDVGDFIQVEIEDNGRGIGAKDLPNIFDRFYRTDSSRNSSKGGSGIGLSIVRKIIEDHGGKIWATSKVGIGTEIHFVLRKYQEVIRDEENTDH
ncbi:MAG: HAMP domain-containing histidine kinase [Hungatella sp.]|nr:HAMP domain-containing histidine kinase [Hungatella sp.]